MLLKLVNWRYHRFHQLYAQGEVIFLQLNLEVKEAKVKESPANKAKRKLGLEKLWAKEAKAKEVKPKVKEVKAKQAKAKFDHLYSSFIDITDSCSGHGHARHVPTLSAWHIHHV